MPSNSICRSSLTRSCQNGTTGLYLRECRSGSYFDAAPKVLAIKRVTENQGKRTSGVDQIIWDTPEKKAMAVSTLRQHGYRALPLRRVYIPKSGGMGKTVVGRRRARYL